MSDAIAARFRASEVDIERVRERSSTAFRERQRSLQTKIDCGYDDYVERRIWEALWTRKSAEWETELATVNAEIDALDRPAPSVIATGQKI